MVEDDLQEFLGLLSPAVLHQDEKKLYDPTDEDVGSLLDALLPVKPLPAPPPQDQARMADILVRSLNGSLTAGWPYNPRSDRHSVIKCFGLLFDLLRADPGLVNALRQGSLTWGINSKVNGKALDLVLGAPATWTGKNPPRSLFEWVAQYDIRLSPEELAALQAFGDLSEGRIHAPLLAVEAKAVMTDHAGALPRVSDELERFRLRVQDDAITVALVLVNSAETFVSPGRHQYDPSLQHAPSTHRQPEDALRVASTVAALPRRTTSNQPGFDAVGLIFLNCPNDGTPMSLHDLAPPGLAYPSIVQTLSRTLALRL